MFVYFTQGMVTKKVIRIGSFMIASGILLFSGLKVMLFGVVLLAMLSGDVAGLLMGLKHRMYYVYFEEKSIVFVEDQVKRIFASHIKEIEYRYEIFYLTLKNDQVRLIEMARIEGEEDRKAFIQEFIFWATTYQLPFTEEAKQKLGIR